MKVSTYASSTANFADTGSRASVPHILGRLKKIALGPRQLGGAERLGLCAHSLRRTLPSPMALTNAKSVPFLVAHIDVLDIKRT